jgi:hypothetical protein
MDVLKTNVRVQDQQSTQKRIGNGVQRASGERGHGEGDKASGEEALEAPVVASVGVVWVGHESGCVDTALDLLGQRGQDLLALRGMEGSDAGRLGRRWARKGRAELLDERRRLACGAGEGREDALGGGGAGEAMPEQAGAQNGSHCCLLRWAMESGGRRGERRRAGAMA